MNKILSFLKDSGTKIRTTHPIRQIVAFSVFAIFSALTFISAAAKHNPNRSIFYFPASFSSNVEMEIRYLPREKNQNDRFRLYLDELMLGPSDQQCDPLFTPEATLLSSFIRGRDAYINLSAEAVQPGSDTLKWSDVYRILKKNVFTNFRNIARIYIYIDGQEVYVGEPPVNVKTKK